MTRRRLALTAGALALVAASVFGNAAAAQAETVRYWFGTRSACVASFNQVVSTTNPHSYTSCQPNGNGYSYTVTYKRLNK